MSGYVNRIQGTDRLVRIRRTRNVAFAGIGTLTVFLIFARLGSEGASLKPFFLPVNGIIEVSLIMGLFLATLGLYLRNLEIRHAQRDSQRYLMAKSSMARAMRTAGLAIGLAVILLLAVTPSLAASLVSDAPQVVHVSPRGREVVSWTSPDPLGLTFVTHAIVFVTAGQATVTLFRNNVTVANTTLDNGQRDVMNVEPTMWASSARWALVIKNALNSDTYVTFVLEKGIVPTLFSTVPFLLFLSGGSQIAWWIVLRPIRDRTKSASLAMIGDLDASERVYDGTPVEEEPELPPAPDPEPGAERFNVPTALPTVLPRPGPATPPARAPSIPLPTPSPSPAVRAPEPRPAPPPVVRQPETPATLAAKAEKLAAALAYEPALAAYEEALRLDPLHLASLQGRAWCLVRLNRKDQALAAYRRVLGRDEKNLTALRAIIRLHADDRRWRECLEAAGELLRVRPNEASAIELKGDALTNLGRRPEALAAYEEAASLDPQNENLRQKIEEARVDVPGLLSRALIGSASGNYPQALSLFDDILEVEPSNVNALIGKAVAYRRSGKPQEALNCLDLVLGVQANNAAAMLNRGAILQELGELDAAVDAYDRLTQLYPNDEEAWAAQGDVFVKMGRDDDALRAYMEALKLSPGDEGIQRHILELEAAKVGPSGIFEELCRIKGIGKLRAKALIDSGFKTAEDLANANPKDLLAIRGITRKVADDLRDHFRAALTEAR
jgi:tetratricopeptide (TPR) repeat protein